MITETECYIGAEDTACHAFKGKTERTKIMWQEGGVCYVYLCYGIHQMLNFVTGKSDEPQAVLIRGVQGFAGPGRTTKALQIDSSFNGESLMTDDRIWVEDTCQKPQYTHEKRIGIDYATPEYRDKLWRFIVHNL